MLVFTVLLSLAEGSEVFEERLFRQSRRARARSRRN